VSAAATARPGRSLLQTLQDEPERFEFDAAVAVLMQAAGTASAGQAIRFHASTGLAFVPSDVAAVEPAGGDGIARRFRLSTGLLGLTGPSGVLPRPFTELVNTERRRRSPALAAFLDVLAQRPLAHFAMAGIKYRPHRAAQAAASSGGAARQDPAAGDALRHMVLALTGYGTPHLTRRLATGTDPLLFYAGLFAARPRSADRLGALVSDWLGQPVEIEQFDGTWLELAPSERTRLPTGGRPGRFNALGVDAAIGARAWDVQSRIRVRIGPLSIERFNALGPDQPLFHRLTALIRAYLDGETRFAINPILAAAAVPPLGLRRGAPIRLGWNAWLPTGGGRRRDGIEAVQEIDGLAARTGAHRQDTARDRK
jgi:type VI secretion system protein ImpH